VIKLLSASEILRTAVAIDAVPADAAISRGEVQWESGGLAYNGWLAKERSGGLSWGLNVGDATFGAAMEKYGRMSVRIRGDYNEILFPSKRDEALDEFLSRGLGVASHFVKDRSDLSAVLASPGDVARCFRMAASRDTSSKTRTGANNR
jgi:hypothetical protein